MKAAKKPTAGKKEAAPKEAAKRASDPKKTVAKAAAAPKTAAKTAPKQAAKPAARTAAKPAAKAAPATTPAPAAPSPSSPAASAAPAARKPAPRESGRGDRPWRDTALVIASLLVFAGAWYALLSQRFPLSSGKRPLAWAKTDRPLSRRLARSLSWDELRDEDDLFANDIVRIPPATKAFAVVGETKRPVALPAGATIRLVDAGGGQIDAIPADAEPPVLRSFPQGDYAPADPAELERRLQGLTARLRKVGAHPILPVKGGDPVRKPAGRAKPRRKR